MYLIRFKACFLALLATGCSTQIESRLLGAEMTRFDDNGYEFVSSKEYLIADVGARTVRADIEADRNLQTLTVTRDLDFMVHLARCGTDEPRFAVGVPGRLADGRDTNVWSVFIDRRSVELARKKYFPDLFESGDGSYCLAIYGGSMIGTTARSTEMELSDRHFALLEALLDDG